MTDPPKYVWLVCSGEYEDVLIWGAFSTEEKADAFIGMFLSGEVDAWTEPCEWEPETTTLDGKPQSLLQRAAALAFG